jgi:hypothetical protein
MIKIQTQRQFVDHFVNSSTALHAYDLLIHCRIFRCTLKSGETFYDKLEIILYMRANDRQHISLEGFISKPIVKINPK